MGWIKCLGKANLDESELQILDAHVQSFRKNNSKKVAEKLAVTARLAEIEQDLQDVQSAIDKAPKPVEPKKTAKQQFEEKKTARQEAKERAAKKIAERKPKFSKSATIATRIKRYVAEYLGGGVKDTDSMVLGDTPNALQLAGADNLPLHTTGGMFKKALKGKHRYYLNDETLVDAVSNIEDPVMVFDSTKSGMVVVTNALDKMGNPVIAAIHLNKRAGRLEVNEVASVYSKEEAQKRFEGWAKDGLLRYYNEKSLDQTTTYPLQLHKVVQFAQDSGTSLATPSDVVKSKTTTKPTGQTKAQVEKQLLDSRFKKPVKKMLDSGKLKIVQSESELPGSAEPLFTKAYHGTPHDFASFKTEHIGAGEGVQAYGWGLYFTDVKDIAEWYSKQLTDKSTIRIKHNIDKTFFNDFDVPVDDVKSTIAELYAREANNKGALKELADDTTYLGRIAKGMISGDITRKGGKIFQVEIPNDDSLIYWDKPLSEQNTKVKSILEKQFKDNDDTQFLDAVQQYDDGNKKAMTEAGFNIFDYPNAAGALYQRIAYLSSQKKASKKLLSLGIRGIKYLSGDSRGKGEGNYNYVIFDESDVTVETKYSKREAIQGAYYKDQDTIYLVADGLTEAAVLPSFQHEAFHGRAKEVLGKQYRPLMQRLSNLEKLGKNNKALNEHFKKAREAIPEDTPEADRMEEFAAYTLESYESSPKTLHKTLTKWAKDFIAAIRVGLMRLGWMPKSVTPQDLSAIARASVRRFAETKVEPIADIAKAEPLLSKKKPTDPFFEENRRIREEHKTLWHKAKLELRRQLFPGGLLPESVFKEKISRDSQFEVTEFDVKHLIGQLERSVKSEYGVSFADLTDADTAALSNSLSGKVGNIKPKTKTAIVAMRQYIDLLSNKYIQVLRDQQLQEQVKAKATGDELAIAQAEARSGLIEIITGNVGTYVHRSYQAFDDKHWFKKLPDSVLNNARKYLKDRYIEQGETEKEAARLTEVTIEEILKNGTAYDSMEGFIKESKLGAKDLSILKKRKEIAPEIRELLGEYTDARLNFAKSATKMSRLIWNHVFLEGVKKSGMDVFLFEGTDRPPSATTQIAADSSEAYSPLNGLWTFPETDQAFKDALGKEQMANWYRTIVQLNGFVKFGKTILSPTTAMRNWQSAMFFTLANGHFDLTQMRKSLSGLREYFLHRGKGAKLEYLRKLKRLGVVYDTPYAGEMMRLLDDTQVIDTLFAGKSKLTAKQALGLAQKFYQFGDDFWKIIGFENEKNLLMKYGKMNEIQAEKEAAERIRNTYPTYSMVGKFVQSLRRFPLAGTFVSFPAEIIRTSGNIVKYIAKDMKNPNMRPIAIRRAAGLGIAAGFAAGLQALSKAWVGIDDDEEEAVRKLAAPWQQNSNLIFTGRDENGRLRYIDISFVDPYNYWKRPFTAVMRDQPWEDKMSGIMRDVFSPFLGTDIAAGTIFEVLANKKDSGGKVYKEHDKPWSQTVDITNHLRKSLQPGLASNMERTWKAIDGQTSTSGKKYTLTDEGLAWVGWRVTTFDPKVALYYRTFEFSDAKSDAIGILRKRMVSPNKVSDKDLKSAFEDSMELRERAYTDMSQLATAARKSGLTDKDMRMILMGAGMTGMDREAIIKGRVPKWYPPKSIMVIGYKKSKALFDDETYAEFKKRFKQVMSFAKAYNSTINGADKTDINTVTSGKEK